LNASRKSDRISLLWLCGVILLLTILAAVMPRDGFWITDGGNKFMVVKNILRHGSIAMANPAVALDPGNRFFPDAVFHFQRMNERIYSIFPPYFPLLSAPFHRAFGFAGLLILPLAGAAAGLFLLLKLMESWRLDVPWLTVAAAVAAPVVFYAVEFWEMTPGMVPVLLMMLLLERKRDLAAGLVLAAGLWLRPEMFFFVPIVCGLLFFGERRRSVIFGAGFLAGFLPYGVTQVILFGSVPGIHGASYAETARNFLANYRTYLAPAGMPCLGVIALLLGTAPRFRSLGVLKVCFCGLCILLGAWQLFRLAGSDEGVFNTGRIVDIFTTTPFVYVPAANWRPLWNAGNRKIRFAARVCILYTLLVPALLTSSDMGIIWGARHWIFLMPVIVLLTWYSARGRGMKTAVLGLFLLSAAFQIFGLHLQYLMRSNSVRLSEFLRENTEDVIVSDVYFLPMQTPARFFDRRWLFVKDGRALFEAAKLLREKKQSFALVRSAHPGYRRYDNPAIAEFLKLARISGPPRKIRLPGTSFLEIEVFPAEPR